MQAFHRKLTVLTGFAVLLAILVVDAVLIRREVQRQVRSHELVVHTEDVLVALTETQGLLSDAETGQRGYLYTGNPSYLEPYNRARNTIDQQINQLAALAADNPRQQERIATLRGLAGRKLDELAATIALEQAGRHADARALVLTNQGKQTMDQLRSLLAEMRAHAFRLDAERTAEYSRSVRFTRFCIFLTSVLGALGLIGLAYSILREMQLRERYASELLARESWFRITLASIGDGVVATDRTGRVTYLNPVAQALTGFSLNEAQGKPIETVFPIFNEQSQEPVENPVAKVMAAGRIVGLANHTVLRHASGRLIPIEDSAAPIRNDRDELIGVVLVFRDATHERRTQELLRKSEKIATAARLASTMAHEINNPLEAVGNLIYLTRSLSELPAEGRQYLETAEQELQRVAHMTHQTLGFYRESVVPESADLSALVASVLKLFSNKLRSKNISVRTEFQSVEPVLGYTGEIKQVIANLVSNAADAVEPNGTIRITIASEPGGHKVSLTVRDDGPGVPAEHQARLFEPFFTTKKDIGTGLGLWVVKEVAERHGGSVLFSSNAEDGRGAAFTVLLPAQASQASAAGIE